MAPNLYGTKSKHDLTYGPTTHVHLAGSQDQARQPPSSLWNCRFGATVFESRTRELSLPGYLPGASIRPGRSLSTFSYINSVSALGEASSAGWLERTEGLLASFLKFESKCSDGTGKP